MTVDATQRFTSYRGNGLLGEFPFSFRAFSGGVNVTVSRDAGGDPLNLVESRDFTLALDINGVGGTITLIGAGHAIETENYLASGALLKAGFTLDIVGETPITQGLRISNQGKIFQKQVEEGLDKLTTIAQEMAALLSGGSGDGGSGAITPTTDTRNISGRSIYISQDTPAATLQTIINSSSPGNFAVRGDGKSSILINSPADTLTLNGLTNVRFDNVNFKFGAGWASTQASDIYAIRVSGCRRVVFRDIGLYAANIGQEAIDGVDYDKIDIAPGIFIDPNNAPNVAVTPLFRHQEA